MRLDIIELLVASRRATAHRVEEALTDIYKELRLPFNYRRAV